MAQENLPNGKHYTPSESSWDSTDYTFLDIVLEGIYLVCGAAVSVTAMILAYRGNLAIFSPREPVVLDSFSSKLEFTSRYWIIGLLWLFININLLFMKRFGSKAISPLSGDEHLVEPLVKIFTNSVEQLFMSIISQVTVIGFLEPEKVVSMIPLVNVLYFIGRFLFFMGYPKKRGFGLCFSMVPVTLAVYLAVYHFAAFWLNPDFIIWRNV